jgi:hypothetical protein
MAYQVMTGRFVGRTEELALLRDLLFTRSEHRAATGPNRAGRSSGRRMAGCRPAREVRLMRPTKVRMGWLGWVVAGVLAVTAGGAALAATGQGPVATVSEQLAAGQGRKAGVIERLAHRKRRALHGEVTVKTDEGTKTVVFARGKVTAVSGSGLTITSEDQVATTFALNGETRFGTRFALQSRDDLRVGVQATAAGEKQGETVTARRVVVNPDRPPPKRQPAPTTTS